MGMNINKRQEGCTSYMDYFKRLEAIARLSKECNISEEEAEKRLSKMILEGRRFK